ncbi:DMT family transporter [Terrisporobacter glycolicus]|uniref:EamA domain-containing protein n=1 Tax=Terrisporobacter glycolicus ATCC 14880 = DSM 1288 TaxID=1121315 RepID=A0ABZ2EVG2_9FIRM|nr:DMT family transporter [Terrisporobacter glycolicus]
MKKGYLYIAIATILFSSMEIMLKTISQSFNPIQLTFERFFIGGLILLPFAIKSLKSKDEFVNKEDIKQFLFLGFMCVVVSMIFYQLAVNYTKASVVAVIFSCNPVFVMIFAYMFLKEVIHSHNVLSLILEIMGIIIIINPLSIKLSSIGLTLTLLAAITFALYGVLGKKSTSKFGGEVVTCFSFILGSIEMLILILIGHIPSVSHLLTSFRLDNFANVPLFTGYNMDNILSVIYVYVFVTGLGYASYFKSMEETSANTASLVFFFKPVLSPILAFIFIKEFIPMNMIVGIVFIVVGSIFTIICNMSLEKKLLANDEEINSN